MPSRFMKKYPAFGVALLASLAIAAVGAGSASALTMTPSTGSFGVQKSGSALNTSAGAWTYRSCEATEGTLNRSSATGGPAWFKFEGCKGPFNSICTSPGYPSGTIAAGSLNYKLVYLDAAKTKFGMMFTPENASGTFAEFSCGLISFKWKGSLIGRITNPALGVGSVSATLSFQPESGNTQQYRQIEGAGPVYQLTETKGTEGTPTNIALSANETLVNNSGTNVTFQP
jgi:hypothetical protein